MLEQGPTWTALPEPDQKAHSPDCGKLGFALRIRTRPLPTSSRCQRSDVCEPLGTVVDSCNLTGAAPLGRDKLVWKSAERMMLFCQYAKGPSSRKTLTEYAVVDPFTDEPISGALEPKTPCVELVIGISPRSVRLAE